MRKIFGITGWLAVLSVCLALPLGAAPAKPLAVVSGWIRVASEDNKGKVLSVEIVVGEPPQEEPYLVLTGGVGSQLHGLVGEWIVASGVVTEDSLGWKSIEVTRFTKMDDLPPEEAPRAKP